MKKILLLILCILVPRSTIAQSDIIFFSDSPDGDVYYDASWGFFTNSSYLELEKDGDKFPVDTDHVFQGRHSLRLHWRSESGGDWGIAVASVGWTAHDVTPFDSIIYWINAPESILNADLPDVAIEDMNDRKSTRVWIGDYFAGVDDDVATWQTVSLPLNAFQPGEQYCDFTRIKTIYHFQKYTDGADHTAWLDEIRIVKAEGSSPDVPEKPEGVTAIGHDSRIDLKWSFHSQPGLLGCHVYRSDDEAGPYNKISTLPHENLIYSDFIGENDVQYYYYITGVNTKYEESEPSDTVFASTYQMTDEELLTSVQEATFRYFYDHGHPVSGLSREISTSGDVCTSGGTGFGLMTIMVGADRGLVSRDSAAVRILKILRFLQDKCTRYHGAWPHWINGRTGETIPFSTYDDGGDLVETSYVIQGLLTVRKYFDQANAVEEEIRQRATQMWEDVEWDWYRRGDNGLTLYWHWSSNYDWRMNMSIVGFNEAMIVYLLAIASPTHPVPASLYDTGWSGSYNYANGNTFYGYKQWVGPSYGGPLFFTHYSFLGFDPRNKEDKFCDYFENNRHISLIHREYCKNNPHRHAGYDSLTWGLTASYNPWGYSAHAPFFNDNGTITPTAAISAMPYTPEESIAALKNFYHTYGPQLWGEFGFRDAFNMDQNWFAPIYVAIDQGTIVPMIENYRTQLCWNMFMANDEIDDMLRAIGWNMIGITDDDVNLASGYRLHQNYPNPFNSTTIIRYTVPQESHTTITLYNILGERVKIILDKTVPAGAHQIVLDASDIVSGVYIYKIQCPDFSQTRKCLHMR
ncbi:T9SS type A sorting domain-containing protein [candidate division KSB1 bacterium]|nr:T9SS type A sorting domain-containing protein [candidate division KSB1 bacterium]